MDQPDIRHEVTLAYGAVLASPGRLLRFCGLPLLGALAVFLWIGFSDPAPLGDPTEMNLWIARNSGAIFVGSLLSLWGYGRFLVRWYRWTVNGDDSSGLLDPGLGRAELKTVGWAVLIGFATLPAMLVMIIVASALAGVGATAFGIVGGEAGALFGGLLGGQVGSVAGFLAVCYALVRLTPGMVPLALGGPAALGRSWTDTAPVAVRATGILWFLALPLNLFGVLVGLSQGLLDGPVATAVNLGLTVLFYATGAVFTARLWQATNSASGSPPVAADPDDD